NGILTTVAGGGSIPAENRNNVPATSAFLQYPSGVAVGIDETLYFAEANRIHKVDLTTGLVSVVAGGGNIGGDGPALQRSLGTPQGIASGPDGSLYIADQTR